MWLWALAISLGLATAQYFPDSLILCDDTNPCPAGAMCRYSRLTQGVKVCYSGNLESSPRPGRCPIAGERLATTPLGPCYFDQQCPRAHRCCDIVGQRLCTRAFQIPTSPTLTILVLGFMNVTDGGFNFVGTVSLVQSKGKNILFDTGGVQQKIQVINNLKTKAGLYPDDINLVVTSHGHPDHYANINMWPDIPQNFDKFLIKGITFSFNPLAKQQLYYLLNDTDLELMETPGHTPQDTTLIVSNVPGMGTVALAGDLFLYKDDYQASPPISSTSYSPNTYEASRKRVACLADYIVPGHGPMFRVEPVIKNQFNCGF